MSSSGNVWTVNRIQHICNTCKHKSPISGLFLFSKRSQRERILLYFGIQFNTIYYTSEFRFWGVFYVNCDKINIMIIGYQV